MSGHLECEAESVKTVRRTYDTGNVSNCLCYVESGVSSVNDSPKEIDTLSEDWTMATVVTGNYDELIGGVKDVALVVSTPVDKLDACCLCACN